MMNTWICWLSGRADTQDQLSHGEGRTVSLTNFHYCTVFVCWDQLSLSLGGKSDFFWDELSLSRRIFIQKRDNIKKFLTFLKSTFKNEDLMTLGILLWPKERQTSPTWEKVALSFLLGSTFTFTQNRFGSTFASNTS